MRQDYVIDNKGGMPTVVFWSSTHIHSSQADQYSSTTNTHVALGSPSYILPQNIMLTGAFIRIPRFNLPSRTSCWQVCSSVPSFNIIPLPRTSCWQAYSLKTLGLTSPQNIMFIGVFIKITRFNPPPTQNIMLTGVFIRIPGLTSPELHVDRYLRCVNVSQLITRIT